MTAHVIGLTGSIGMGKSTTAQMFADAGVPVWDADAAVHELYAPGGAAVAPLADLIPEAIENRAVNRDRLRTAILADDTLLPKIEAIVHPLVAAHRKAFLERHSTGEVLLDIPLLFEIGQQRGVDTLVVVSAPADVQRQRVLARPGMTEESFAAILSRQVPDAEKRAAADFVVDTSRGLDNAREQVHAVLASIRERHDA
ncbi:dephospho-CoA kinase [Pontivivens ytuae]|uniref:Dephospho-CoA kinase n=1 Tax=Pontivivens ytuae TaxID=2789856 RepID=A0A7S9LV49_9RHOB|nr:dephospho-CoA kinase [Pontivivens ytuae]QPH55892.1 dephospho-CoA kinase [Pontivivens ytuae]